MAELRKRGLTTAVICSTPFEKLGRAQARIFGVPELPLVMISHPLGGIAMDNVRERAAMRFRSAISMVITGYSLPCMATTGWIRKQSPPPLTSP